MHSYTNLVASILHIFKALFGNVLWLLNYECLIILAPVFISQWTQHCHQMELVSLLIEILLCVFIVDMS